MQKIVILNSELPCSPFRTDWNKKHQASREALKSSIVLKEPLSSFPSSTNSESFRPFP